MRNRNRCEPDDDEIPLSASATAAACFWSAYTARSNRSINTQADSKAHIKFPLLIAFTAA